MRGKLTEEIKEKSKQLLGYEINQQELRLMPYLIFCITNNQNIDPAKVNDKEREILMKWQKEEKISSPSSDLMITKEFYDICNEIIFLGYISSVGRSFS